MSKFYAVACAVALLAVPVGAYAGDGDKVEKKDADPKPVVVKSAPAVPPSESSDTCNECHRGNKFTRFWTHTVGGNVGGGLKKGSSKIAGAF